MRLNILKEFDQKNDQQKLLVILKERLLFILARIERVCLSSPAVFEQEASRESRSDFEEKLKS